ncbi:probable RNA helicase armi [Euwallacea fornicatus]|uniref:probable RNA helicase armi n=1 Tax=Euwallacea fornicatus TaxID=995702 RepID=UPI00338E5719
MFSYILSFFRNPHPELSYEEASAILAQNEELTVIESQLEASDCGDSVETIQKFHEVSSRKDNNFFTKVGSITGTKDEKFIIDTCYEFSNEDSKQHFQVGDRVSYQMLVSEGKIDIYNVTFINTWDSVVPRENIAAIRVMVCKVEKREKRIVFLTPGDIKVNLDHTHVEFIPHVGDWVEVEVKYEVNEHALDLSGEIIEVNKLWPMRPHIEAGKVTLWDPQKNCGIINRKIFIDRDSLSCGYIPVIGDEVVAEIIESEQNGCSWRALKVLPEFISNRFKNVKSDDNRKFELTHPALEISNCFLNFDKLGQSRIFNINLENKSKEIFKLLSLKVSENSQIALTDQLQKPKEILPNSKFNLELSCTPKTIGISNEFIEFTFESFTLGKYVNISVNLGINGRYYQKSKHVPNYNNIYSSSKQLIRGQKQGFVRFQAFKFPNYDIPKKMLDLVIQHGGAKNYNVDLIEKLKVVQRSLFSNLDPINYEEKFHALLHMDEIANLIHIRQYDQERACFIPNKDFLMLEIENLAEKRPSIILGDRIIASNPFGNSNEEFEGNVFKVGAKHIYLKFSPMFHDMYRGEDYSVRIIPGRTSYRRLHYAIHLVVKHLGRDWLFPTKVIEKNAQVEFVYEPHNKPNRAGLEQITSPKSRKLLTAPELLRKAREARIKAEKEKYGSNASLSSNGSLSDSLIDQDGNRHLDIGNKKNVLKLEWFNKTLNCVQKDTVINILKGVSRPLPYIIFGPPGTGKTVTVTESVLQVMRLVPKSRILVATPSNSAADLIALRLIDSGVVRPGNLVRLVSVNYAMSDNIPLKLTPYCATGSVAIEGCSDENILIQNGMTFDCSRSVLGRHKITVTTCSAAGILHTMAFPRGHFSHIFVDEAGQASEPEVMIPVSFLDKYSGQIILAGDPMQLGPVILCCIAKQCGLDESYLERLTNRFPYVRDLQGFAESGGYDPRFITRLLYNYRSLETILNLFSSLFYHGDLIPTISSTESKQAHLLNSLKPILPKTVNGEVPAIVFHGVEGENYQTADSPSWYNPHEAAQVFYYMNEFLRLGVQASAIGIITPYAKQVREIRTILREAEFPVPKVGTVDDFQGQEFDIIVLSTVRSSSDLLPCDLQHSLGFVSSPRRLNVAISRSKALLIIIGNPRLLAKDIYWRTVIQDCVTNGAYTGCSFST